MSPYAKRAECDASSPRNGRKRGEKKPEKEREASAITNGRVQGQQKYIHGIKNKLSRLGVPKR